MEPSRSKKQLITFLLFDKAAGGFTLTGFLFQKIILGGVVLFVKAVLRGGHVGRGKYHEMTRYLVIDRLVDVLSIARSMPRVKKNNLALIECEQISKAEYLKGKLRESQDPYLNTFRVKGQKGGCRLGQGLHGNIA